MSSVNARVPPSRIAAIDSPADGEVAAYQASSGQFEWVANGSGGGGTVTSVALTETGSALTITGSPITGAGTFNIAGAGTSSQVILGDLSLGTLTSGTVTSVGTSQAFITITSPTTTPSISIGNASASATGVLTATDWNTFNNKGSGSVTSVALTESGNALTVTGSPITGSGTLNISGAGSSSQVILGDLTLGTLTSGTVTGTGSANQVSYWTAASVQAGSTGLTYDPSTGNLTVGGYVETGTKVTTPSGTNLELTTGSASSGSIVIADGANGQISINPNGSGTIKLDGVNLDNSAIATGYILKATSATEAGWAAESSGGSPGGSDTQIQYNDGGSFGGSSVMTFDDTGSAEQVLFSGTSSKAIFRVEQLGAGNSIEVHDASTDTTIFLVDQFGRAAIKTNAASAGYDLTVGGSTFVQGHLKLSTVGTTANPAIKWDGDTTTGINKPSTGEIAIVSAGTETFRFGANNDLEIAGNAGTSGQVFTSGGAGNAASWTTPSGGGTPAGSTGQIQYNDGGSFGALPSTVATFDGTDLTKLTIGDVSVANSNPLNINVSDIGWHGLSGTSNLNCFGGSGQIKGFPNSNSPSQPMYAFNPPGNSGMFASGSNGVGFSVGGTERLRIHDDGEIGLSGANYGTSGQVLTSGGAGAAASWTTVSGGSTPKFSGVKANTNAYYDLSAYPTGWRTSSYTNVTENQSAPIYSPFTCGIDLTLATLGIEVSAAGDAGLNYLLAIYSVDAAGLPDSKLVSATVSADATGTQTGTITETSAGDGDLVAGTQYYYAYTQSFDATSNPTVRGAGAQFHGAFTDTTIGTQRQAIRAGSLGTLPSSYPGSGVALGTSVMIMGCTYV